MIQQVGITRTDIGISQILVVFQWFGGHPFAFFIITSVLSNFADIDFRIKIGSKRFVMVTGITVHNIQVVHLVKMMFCSVGCINTTYSRVEPTTQYSCQSCVFKTFLISPLPTVFEMSFIFRFIVCCIQIIHSSLQTSFHDGQILIRQSYIDDDFGFETIKQGYQFVYIVRIYLCSLNSWIADSFYDCITF